MIKRVVLLLLLVIPMAAQIRFNPVDRDVILDRLKSAPRKNEDRQQALFNMFAEVGCEPVLQPVKHGKAANVICVLKGSTDEQIIVGGHFDHVSDGDGIIDDWSGASILPTLYESLKAETRKYTIVFIGFAKEEDGLVGSEFYVKHLTPADKQLVRAMINLECLGLAQTEVWLSHSDKELTNLLGSVAAAMKLKIQAVNVDQVGSADSESFAKVKIPRMTLHTVTQDTLGLLHTKNDNMNAVHPDDYYDNYRLIAAYVSAADAMLGVAQTSGAKAGK